MYTSGPVGHCRKMVQYHFIDNTVTVASHFLPPTLFCGVKVLLTLCIRTYCLQWPVWCPVVMGLYILRNRASVFGSTSAYNPSVTHIYLMVIGDLISLIHLAPVPNINIQKSPLACFEDPDTSLIFPTLTQT